jgi:outer membrane protein OmpA-like peptidoglycan-associated protein
MNFRLPLVLVLILSCTVVFAVPPGKAVKQTGHSFTYQPLRNFNDTIIIPFEYKQSALFHAFTFEVIDSVVNILKKDTAIRLTIDGYAYVDEGNDTVCKYLSLNRALFVKEYVLGRGIDLSRIISVNGLGKMKSQLKRTNALGKIINCRAELLLVYPPPPPKIVVSDRDEDGIADADDKCPDEYGYIETNGCPNKDRVVVPFENNQASLHSLTYIVLDSVVNMLKENPLLTISIEGHAYKDEGTKTVCDNLAKERAAIAKEYLMSRYVAAARIEAVKSFGSVRPLNAGKNPQEKNRNARVEIVLNRHQQ